MATKVTSGSALVLLFSCSQVRNCSLDVLNSASFSRSQNHDFIQLIAVTQMHLTESIFCIVGMTWRCQDCPSKCHSHNPCDDVAQHEVGELIQFSSGA